MTEQVKDVRRKSGVSPVSSLIGTLFKILFWLTISLVLSIIVEWVGLFTLWSDQGVNHSMNIFSTELEYANERVANSMGFDSAKGYLSEVMGSIDTSGVIAYEWINALKTNVIVGYFNNFKVIEDLFVSAFFITKVFCLRLFILIFALPVLLLAAWVACVDGMVERELRKAGNDRESNVIFDFAVSYSYWVIILMAVLYLASPFASNPMYFILPGAAVFFLFLRTSFAMYKKYV